MQRLTIYKGWKQNKLVLYRASITEKHVTHRNCKEMSQSFVSVMGRPNPWDVPRLMQPWDIPSWLSSLLLKFIQYIKYEINLQYIKLSSLSESFIAIKPSSSESSMAIKPSKTSAS